MPCELPSRDLRGLIEVVGSVPLEGDEPVFREPWEAQAFAMVLSLHERGLFTWQEWADSLSRNIKAAQDAGDPDTGATYYKHWLASLEDIVRSKALLSKEDLAERKEQWRLAAERTPHGQPILLNSAYA